MAGRIPPEFIDQLLSRVDIVDVIDRRVGLRRAGKEYQACCPFHDEKTPSFTVSREKQFYHCFGCGAHGTAVGFLMEYDRLGFVDAVEELARMAGLEVPRTEGEARGPSLAPLYETLEEAARYYRRQLRAHPQARRAVDYLKGRGLSGEIAAEYGLGYAPPGWNNLVGDLGGQPDRADRLSEAGLLAERSGRTYDRFRDRIMFPIRDPRGRVLGFGGRAIGEGEPKYLNSPETPLFHKGSELYGLFEARQALRHVERIVIVEGYMDVIALAQFGIRYAVATLGTATTVQHLEKLSRTAPEILFCFDGDAAGKAAAWKALTISLPFARAEREFRFLFLPQGEDPDTLVRKEGKEGFEARLQQATPLSDFLFDRLGANLDTRSLDGQARFAAAAQALLRQVPAGLYRDMLTNRLTETVGLDRAQLGLGGPARRTSVSRNGRNPRQVSAVRLAIALLVQQPELAPLAAEVADDWRGLDQAGVPLLKSLLETLQTHPKLNTAALVERDGDTESAENLRKLVALYPVTPGTSAAEEFVGALERLNEQFRGQQSKQLASHNRPSEMSPDDKRRLLDLINRRRPAVESGEDIE